MPWFGQLPLQIPGRMSALAGNVGRATLDFVYPPRCLFCGGDLVVSDLIGQPDAALCGECRGKLLPPPGNACRCCGAPLGPFTVSNDGCPLCRRENFAFDEVIRLGLYRDEMRRACLRAKNASGAFLSRALADLLAEKVRTTFADQALATVIHVPEHWAKRLVRQHYAAETIAHRLASRLKVRLATGILAKCRWTPKQAKSPPAQRRQQQKGAFHAVEAQALRGQTVLLVDDILTTGATADAAARALKRAGASRVVVVVLAVSPPSA